MTCRDCIEEGTATGGPCTEPRHQAAELTEALSGVSTQALLTTMYEIVAAAAARTQERDSARRWAVALEQECARLADQVRVLTATNNWLCAVAGLDPAVVADLTDTALAAARAEV